MKRGILVAIFIFAFIYAAQEEIVVTEVRELRGAAINAISIVSDDEISLATHRAGIQKSTDGGVSFRPLGNPLSNQTLKNNNFNSIYVDGTNIYAGGGGFFNSPGFHFSTDGGNNFEYKGLEGINVNEIIHYNNGVLLATTGQGVNFFDNNTLSNFGTGLENFNVEVLYYDINTPDLVLAGTDLGLYKYENTSQTWSSILSSLKVTDFAKGSGNNVYAASFGNVYVSDDLTNFNLLPLNLPDLITINTIAFSEPNLFVGIVASDFENDVQNVYRFNTITNTLEDNTAGLPQNPGPPNDLVISNGNKFLGTSTGFFMGPIDGDWQNPVEELTAGQISFVDYNPYKELFIVGGKEGDVHGASDLFGVWDKNDWGLQQGSAIEDMAFSSTGTISLQLQKLSYQENIGDKFENRDNGVSGIWYNSIAHNPTDDVTVLGTYNGLFYSTNFGEQWLTTNVAEFIWKVRYSSAENKFFATTFTDLLKSDGNGQNFEIAVANVNPVDFAINDDPLNFKIGVSTTTNFIEYDVNFNPTALGYAGLDPGDIIEKVGYGIEPEHNLGAGASKLYSYSFTDSEWREAAEFDNSIADLEVVFLNFEKNSNSLNSHIILIATLGGGLYSSAEVTDVDSEVRQLITSYKLAQNFPNPFNPTTTISYSIQSSSFVTIKVFDVLGKEVATLVNEEKPMGSFEVNFDASSLSSGVYFYKIEAGEFVDTRKMMLIK